MIDVFNRQVMSIEADTSLPSLRVVRVLGRLKQERELQPPVFMTMVDSVSLKLLECKCSK